MGLLQHTKLNINPKAKKMNQVISKLKYSLLLIGVSTYTFAQDLPSEFDQVINDNPTDAPIDGSIWFVLMVSAIVVYLFYKNRKVKA